MPQPSRRRLLSAMALMLVLALPVHAIVDRADRRADPRRIERASISPAGEKIELAEPTVRGEMARSFVSAHGGQWEFRFDRRTGRPDLVQGSGIPMIPGAGNRLGTGALAGLPLQDGTVSLETLEPLARQFLDRNRALLVPDRGRLELDKQTSAIREDGRLASLYFNWLVDDVPVEGAAVYLRLNSGNITQLGAPLVAPTDVETTPAVSHEQALALLMDHSGDEELYRLVGEPELLIQPEIGARDALRYRLIWKISYRVPDRPETWEGRLDAQTGEVIGFRDTNLYGRAVGGVYPRTVFEDNETSVPMPAVELNLESGSVTADASGGYSYVGGQVETTLGGRWFNSNCQGCTNPARPSVSSSLGSGWLDFGLGGADQIGNGFSTPADRNAFYHLNQVRRVALKWLPTLPFLDQNFQVNVNISDTCNAFYDGLSVNFFRSGGGCNNTGEVSDVMHHEYGHGLDGNTRGGDGSTGEGTADCVAMHLSHSPLIGPGFRTTGSPVRDVRREAIGLYTRSVAEASCDGSVHCQGRVLGQTVWELAQALVGEHGLYTGWRQSERLFFTSLPDQGSQWADGSFPIYDAYINADDDDGNLANGTPNAALIFTAFSEHQIANSSYPSSTPCARPEQPQLAVTPQCDRFGISWNEIAGVDHYELMRAEVRLDSAFYPVAELPAGETAYEDLEVAPGVDYWYVVLAVSAAGCESTMEDPVAARLVAQPVLEVVAGLADDTPGGNRSGFADPGEEVDLRLTVQNFGELAATTLSGTVVSDTPGVALVDGYATWPDLPAGAAADNSDTLRFETDDLQLFCGDRVRFQFLPSEGTGCAAATSFFDVELGERVPELTYDFESGQGWSPDPITSTASSGDWVRGDPQATSFQPGNDVSDPGVNCWYTAPNPTGGIGTDDVDDGVVVLISPTIDLSALSGVELTYWRWFANRDVGEDPGDFFTADISDDDGASWNNLETLDFNSSAPSWTQRSFKLEDYITLTDQVRIRFLASDGPATGNLIEAAIDEVSINRFVCDDTPACFTEPSFNGLQSASVGSSCGEIELSWQEATSNCANATLLYNVYRSTDPGFIPGPANLLASGLTTTSLSDSLLAPGQSYSYVVRADDSRSGEDSNLLRQVVAAPAAPDVKPPLFEGLRAASTGAGCGEIELSWQPALESCSAPVSYEIYRDTDPAFIPGSANRVGSSLSASFVDVTLIPGTDYTYVVRARDGAGNEDINDARIEVSSSIQDRVIVDVDFEAGFSGWKSVAPNDATGGNWEWGDPEQSTVQSEDDASEDGVNCWITGLLDTLPTGGNNDVDDGTTTLQSALYDTTGLVDPAVSYARWFSNDRGAAPGEDPFVIEVSNDNGASWQQVEQVNSGTPLAWIDVEFPLLGLVTPMTDQMRFRFTASDLGSGSLVEAGIDEFAIVDRSQGCLGCPLPVQEVETIYLSLSGDDVLLDWSGDPASGARFAVYSLSGAVFEQAVRIGTAEGRTFVHEGAALSSVDFAYRVSVIDPCGNESDLE